MSDGVPDAGGDPIQIERNARVQTSRDEEGRLISARVVSEYRVYRQANGERVREADESAALTYEIDDATATLKSVVSLATNGNGEQVELAGLQPNALRTAPAAEDALRNVPGVEEVQLVEDVVDSVVSVARYDGGDR